MSFFHNSALIGASGQSTGYRIERSLRFNSPDSAYLSRTFASIGNRKTWTWSAWVKRSTLGGNQTLFGGPISQNYCLVWFVGDTLSIENYNAGSITTSAVFRDTSSWYHIVAVVDTTNAIANDRMIIYVNGTRQAAGSYSAPTQNADLFLNQATEHRIARFGFNGFENWFNGYLTEIHFVDGQALTPSSFAETNIITGQWVPKRYTGTYGTNGFRLDFSDNSAATATTLGKDRAGSNNWTPFNLSVTAGAGNDSLVDTPTSYGTDTGTGGQVRGDYATWNPLNASATYTNGNLDVTNTVSLYSKTTIGVSSGKYYCEYTINSASTGFGPQWGFIDAANTVYGAIRAAAGRSVSAGGVTLTLNNHSSDITSGIIGLSLDMDVRECKIYHNNSLKATITGIPIGTYFFYIAGDNSSDSVSLNAGQRPFAYTAPSGFKALCDTNLPVPTIAKGNTVMDVVTYTGNGGTQSVSGLGFSPDLVWIKSRSTSDWHHLFDSVRGTTKYINSNATDSETTNSTTITSFDSAGFTSGNYTATNGSGKSLVAWCWDAGSSTVTNTAGSISSQVRANASAGFSVVTYTGNGSGNVTIGHGLGVAPQFIITKRRDTANNWISWHGTFAANDYIALNLTSAKNYGGVANTTFGGTSGSLPTSSVFTVGIDLNGSSATFVAYCFAPVAGYSAFGSYTGNGSSDGPFVFCNFRPRWFMYKRTDAAGFNWVILDSARDSFNVSKQFLFASAANGEGTASALVDFTSNGVKVRADGSDTATNASGGTYIYAAFAENPFQYARAR